MTRSCDDTLEKHIGRKATESNQNWQRAMSLSLTSMKLRVKAKTEFAESAAASPKEGKIRLRALVNDPVGLMLSLKPSLRQNRMLNQLIFWDISDNLAVVQYCNKFIQYSLCFGLQRIRPCFPVIFTGVIDYVMSIASHRFNFFKRC